MTHGHIHLVYTLGFPIFIKGLDYIITRLFGDGSLALLPPLRFSYTIRAFPFEWFTVNLVVRHLWYCYQFSTGLPLSFWT
ncbi:gp68 [Brochothrix phage A9]|uniref:Gp68 n=1 Tax=Brochothrix phage A9 TaxID=857312 RepID=D9J0L5_9CAUD|nr:gp68 [Brochothrix phage A9]ADJ53108.1 gp68 [Brochothrix phage A9]